MNNSIITYVLIAVIGLFIFIVGIRAIFNIPTIVKNLKAQTKLLNEIAKAHGVSKGVIDIINSDFENKNH